MSYSRAVSAMHWLSAPAMMASIGSVLQAQALPKGDKGKGTWMFRHKSMGLLAGLVVGPRFAVRIMSKAPPPVGGNAAEQLAAKVSHGLLYGFLAIMPASGIAMGYFGGKGLPFFFTTIPGASTANGEIAKNAYKLHKQVGYYGKFLVPVHIGATGFHLVKGQNILRRINPFS
ncbi:unnamed protein product [Chrysoparadoxa australica]